MQLSKIHKILVVGLGYRTGLSAANFLAGRGYDVAVSDSKKLEELSGLISKLDKRVRIFSGEQITSILDEGFDLLVISPGVPKKIPLVASAIEKKIPVISEIELAYNFLNGTVIGITGTDGKSTTTCLTGHILEQIGFKSFIGGNIGIPLVSIAEKTTDDSFTVIELSSYQLETVDKFRPDAALIMNVTPDHLDRYDSMKDYFEAKMRITMNQTENDFFIYNADDETVVSGLDMVKAQKLGFSLAKNNLSAYFDSGFIFLNINGSFKKILDASRLQIVGLHNVQNVMASILMIKSVLEKRNIVPDYEKIADACCSFKGLAHRMEVVGEFEGRLFINDSKATTVGAVQMAIKSLTRPGILILGGRTKGDDYSRLMAGFEGKIKGLVLVGESKDLFGEIFKGFNTVKADSFDEAAIKAMSMSKEGDAVLLSPACASFDMFTSYEERGDIFRKSFEKLVSGELKWI